MLTNRNISNGIIVDLWGTLFDDSSYCDALQEDRAKVLSKICGKYSLSYPKDGWIDALREERIRFRQEEATGTILPIRSRIGRLLHQEEERNIDGCIDEAIYHFQNLVKSYEPKVNATLVRHMKTWHDRGLPIVLLSNSGFIDNLQTRRLLLKMGVALLLDYLLLSSETGLVKPDPRAFLMACHVMKRCPQDSILIGDDPTMDFEGGQSVGVEIFNVHEL